MMKSQKAKELIEKYAVGNSRDAAPSMMRGRAVECVEIAEQEAEERMREKAHKIVKEMMGGIFQGDMPQKIADEFIQKLTEE